MTEKESEKYIEPTDSYTNKS